MSAHFARDEFACKCGCGFAAMDEQLVNILEDVRAWAEHSPVRVHSGCRCQAHNATVGGTPESYHTKALAADISVKDVMPVDVYAYLDRRFPDRFGLGLYRSWVHFDVRPGAPARWAG